MLPLNSPVGVVPKIGPKYKALLKNLQIETVEDLLYGNSDRHTGKNRQ
jgi:hypothetical protein